MNKSEKTRAFILEKAAPIFNVKGYQATSLSDITEATKLTKGALYGNFGNKNELAAAAYRYNYNQMATRFREHLAVHQTALGKLKAFLDFYKTNWKQVFESGGCPILNASTEVDDQLDYLRPVVRQSIKDWHRSLVSIIDMGKEKGELKGGIDTAYYAYSMVSMIEGGIAMAKVMGEQIYLFNIIDRVAKMIDDEMRV